MASQIAQRAAEVRPTDQRTVRDMIVEHQGEFESALGDSMSVEHFMRGVFTTITANPELADVSEQSLAAGLLWAAQLNLEIGNGMNQFHLIGRAHV